MADSHQRSPIARMNPFTGRISARAARIAVPVALVATLAPIGIGVAAAGGAPVAADLTSVFVAGAADASREPQVSRSIPRVDWTPQEAQRLAEEAATAEAIRNASARLWTLEKLPVFAGSAPEAPQVGELAPAVEVLLTNRKAAGRTEIVIDQQARWIPEGKLASSKPFIPAAGLSMAPCAATGGSNLGLTQRAIYVLRSVCAAFPQISTYGGRDAHGEHRNGQAIDIMTSNNALGTAIANFLIAHASEFNLDDVIWRQRIWMPGHGWDGMANRGSATANHFDHVHVKVN